MEGMKNAVLSMYKVGQSGVWEGKGIGRICKGSVASGCWLVPSFRIKFTLPTFMSMD